MNIYKNITKYIITAGLFIIGSSSFANTLTAIDITSNDNGGKIILNTTEKPVLKKNTVSKNSIKIRLSNTDISEKLTYNASGLNGTDKLNIVQDGNSTVISLTKNNIADFLVLESYKNSDIPVSGKNNTYLISSLILMFLFLNIITGVFRNKNQNRQIQKIKLKINSKTETEKSMLRDLRTLRNKNKISNNSYIHGNPVLRFSDETFNSNMSIPENLSRTIRFNKKETYKTAVNS